MVDASSSVRRGTAEGGCATRNAVGCRVPEFVRLSESELRIGAPRGQRFVGLLLGGIGMAMLWGYFSTLFGPAGFVGFEIPRDGRLALLVGGFIFALVGAGFGLSVNELRVDFGQGIFHRRRGFGPFVRAWSGEFGMVQRLVVRRERRGAPNQRRSEPITAWVASLHVAGGPRGGREKFEMGFWEELSECEPRVREWAGRLGIEVEGLPDELNASPGNADSASADANAVRSGRRADPEPEEPDPAWSAEGLSPLCAAPPDRARIRREGGAIEIDLPCAPREGLKNTAKCLVMAPVFIGLPGWLVFILTSGGAWEGPWPTGRILVMGAAGLFMVSFGAIFALVGVAMLFSALFSSFGEERFRMEQGLLYWERRLFGRRLRRKGPFSLRSIRQVGGGRDDEGQAAIELILPEPVGEFQIAHYVAPESKAWLRMLLSEAVRQARGSRR